MGSAFGSAERNYLMEMRKYLLRYAIKANLLPIMVFYEESYTLHIN